MGVVGDKRTEEGLERSKKAQWVHALYSTEIKEQQKTANELLAARDETNNDLLAKTEF